MILIVAYEKMPRLSGIPTRQHRVEGRDANQSATAVNKIYIKIIKKTKLNVQKYSCKWDLGRGWIQTFVFRH